MDNFVFSKNNYDGLCYIQAVEKYYSNMEITYNNHVLSHQERESFVKYMHEKITDNEQLISFITSESNSLSARVNPDNTLHRIDIVLRDIILIRNECMMNQMLFLQSNTDYLKKHTRELLMVSINEAFKNVYGFDKKKASLWRKDVKDIMSLSYLNEMKNEYDAITDKLEQLSKQHDWYKKERCDKVHIKTDNLLNDRQEPINESKVMIASVPVLEVLEIVQDFVTRMRKIVLINSLVQ